MIPFSLQPEPDQFDQRCRQRGLAWLAEHPEYDRPHDYWSEFEPSLREAFQGLCGWCAMFIPTKGHVDHFIPIKELKATDQHHLAYEWSNFRYVDGWINQKKREARVLDPFDVQAGWFEILLPSMQLVSTPALPSQFQDIAEFTLRRLGLRDGEVIVRLRHKWFEMYQNGRLTLEGLRETAPLIAMAVERDLHHGKDWRT